MEIIIYITLILAIAGMALYIRRQNKRLARCHSLIEPSFVKKLSLAEINFQQLRQQFNRDGSLYSNKYWTIDDRFYLVIYLASGDFTLKDTQATFTLNELHGNIEDGHHTATEMILTAYGRNQTSVR